MCLTVLPSLGKSPLSWDAYSNPVPKKGWISVFLADDRDGIPLLSSHFFSNDAIQMRVHNSFLALQWKKIQPLEGQVVHERSYNLLIPEKAIDLNLLNLTLSVLAADGSIYLQPPHSVNNMLNTSCSMKTTHFLFQNNVRRLQVCNFPLIQSMSVGGK